jgi:hypothetical protein
MDLLTSVAEPGRDLLSRVDSVLAGAGAPADHPVWPLLRRVGALPGDVLEAFCALAPDRLGAAGEAVRVRAETYAEERADLAAAVAATGWTGGSASAFEHRWDALGGHLGGAAASAEATLAGRLAATASYVDDVAAWMRAARRDLAHEVATALGSLEAVRLRAERNLPASAAAATIGVAVLAVADRQADAAEEVAERWATRLAELPLRPPVRSPGGRADGTSRVPL